MMEHVKNCPFCGDSNVRLESTSDHFYFQCTNSECGSCGAIATSINEAIDKWNRRISIEVIGK